MRKIKGKGRKKRRRRRNPLSADSNVRYGVVVGLEDLRVAEQLVAERVEAIEADEYVGGGDPLHELANRLVVVRRRPVDERAEDDRGARERHNVAELVRAQSDRLVLIVHDLHRLHAVRAHAAGAVVLIGRPGRVLVRALVDGEALGSRRVELHLHVVDLERLAQVQRDVHLVRILDVVVYERLRLPPGHVALLVEVVEVLRQVGVARIARVADLTTRAETRRAVTLASCIFCTRRS